MTLDFRPDVPTGGLKPDGKINYGKVSPAEELALLKTQLADLEPDEHGAGLTAERQLRDRIARLEKNAASSSPLDFQPGGESPRASQADVRASEVPLSPKEGQRVSEAAFEAARKGWMKATGGRLKPGQTANQAISEWAKVQDPSTTREQNEAAELAETGEYEESDSAAYVGSKALAGIGGFALGGPAGATAGEGLVRLASLAHNLDRAVKAGMSEDQAAQILSAEMMKGTATDAALNFGLPLVGQLIAKIPGATWIGAKVKPLIESKLAKREALTADPARKQAVRELATRAGNDFIPTPGQVTGETGLTESVVKRAFPGTFQTQEKALTGAAEGMLRETTAPAGQMEAKNLGETITRLADDTQRAVKARLRPAFQAADDLGVQVDMRTVRYAASRALLEDGKVAGGKLKPAERADLEAVFEHLRTKPNMSPEAVLDFISRRKEIARAHTVDGKPSEYFTGIMTRLAGTADAAYTQSARAVGQPEIASNLLRARKQYGGMIETIYEDAMKQALKKNPEDVGRLFWQGGNVSEIEQLHKMLRLAEREGVVGAAGAQKVKQDMARGFLQEAVRDVDSAAKWLDEIKENPLKRRTWDALTQGPDGQALRSAMEVLSHAAQIAGGSGMTGKQFLPLGRAAAGGVGVSYVTGVINPGMAAVGISVAATMKMMATAYTRGDKGAINLMARVLRTNSAATGASAQALQAMLPDLEKLAAKYDQQDIFVPAEQAEPTAVEQPQSPSPFQGGA